jgi:DNA-binding transcriptional LysR family regulator
VSLTPAGEAFRSYAQQSVDLANRAIQIAQKAHRGEWGILNIGFAGSASFTSIPQSIQQFRKKYSSVDIILHELRTPEQVDALLSERIDIGIVRAENLNDERLSVKMIHREKFILALSKQHAFTRHKTIALEMLRNESFVMYPPDHGPGLFQQVIKVCQSEGFEPKISQHASHISTILSFVASGIGIAILPKSVSTVRWPGITFKQIDRLEALSELAVAWKGSLSEASLKKQFVDYVCS